MDRYVGCDAHGASCTFSVRDVKGRIQRRDVVETNQKSLVSYLRSLEGGVHLCVEEGEWSQWLCEILSAQVEEFVVVQPEKREGSKSDARDADGLSARIQTGQLGLVVFKDQGRFSALRDAARVYTMISRDLTRTKNRIKSFCRARGLREPGEALYKPEKRNELICELPSSTQHAVNLLGEQLTVLEALKEEAQARMIRQSHRHRISRILETAPGMGPVRVAQLLPIVVTPHRFRTKRQFWAYCGFGIVTRSSADWVLYEGRWMKARVAQTRGLNQNYNRHLKDMFKSAASSVVREGSSSPLKLHYDELTQNGTKPNLAKLTIARRIAAVVLAMWKNKEAYRPERDPRVAAA